MSLAASADRRISVYARCVNTTHTVIRPAAFEDLENDRAVTGHSLVANSPATNPARRMSKDHHPNRLRMNDHRTHATGITPVAHTCR